MKVGWDILNFAVRRNRVFSLGSVWRVSEVAEGDLGEGSKPEPDTRLFHKALPSPCIDMKLIALFKGLLASETMRVNIIQ